MLSDKFRILYEPESSSFIVYVPIKYQPFEIAPVMKVKSSQETMDIIDGRPFVFINALV